MGQTFFRTRALLGAERLAARTHAAARQASMSEPSRDEARDARELMDQLREVNERLVLATLRSHELAEEADEARALMTLSELRFRSLVHTIAAIVWSADGRGWICFDPQWHVLTGLEATEHPGEWDWLEGVHPGDRERVRAAWSAAVASATPYDCEHRLRLRGGGTAWVRARAVPIPGDQTLVREWMGMMGDITDRKLVEEARDRFIGVLGHDLRTPLTAVDMSAAQLATGQLADGDRRIVDLISRCTGRMRRMIDDVLDFARGRLGGGIPVSLVPADFGHVCRDTVSELAAVHPTRSIVLETSGELTGVWDVDRVEQVIANLVGNALEHGVDPVRVSLRGESDHVVLEINNQNLGPPIPAELLPLLFEPFQRGAPGDDSAGLGLGLYIVSEIVRAHGGTIQVTSSASGGTTFTSRWSRRLPRSVTLPPVSLPWPEAPPL